MFKSGVGPQMSSSPSRLPIPANPLFYDRCPSARDLRLPIAFPLGDRDVLPFGFQTRLVLHGFRALPPFGIQIRIGPYFMNFAYVYTLCHKEGHATAARTGVAICPLLIA